jgi:hypothetical protein
MYKYSNKEHTAVTNLETGASGIHPGVWMWEQYQEWVANGGVPEAFDTIPLADKKVTKVNQNRSACENHITSFYPLAKQSSMSLDIYPAQDKATMIAFIEACIAEENRVAALVNAVTTIEDLEAVEAPTWPTV